jgi:long-chain acyl-CoA synthetase
MHSYDSAKNIIKTLIDLFAIKNTSIYLIAQSLGHLSGITALLMTMLQEGTVVLLENFVMADYIADMERYKVTHINLSASLFNEIAHYSEINRNAFNYLQSCFVGGDMISRNLPLTFTTATGAKMQTGYTMSEVGIITYNQEPYEDFAGSWGKKINGVDIQLRNASGEIVGTKETGEIWIKSPACCIGYWNNETLNAKTFMQGWFRTGDLACADEKGYYWYKGQMSDADYAAADIQQTETIE